MLVSTAISEMRAPAALPSPAPRRVVPLLRLVPQTGPRLEVSELVARLVEVTGAIATARVSFVVALLAEAQRAGETVVWIQAGGGAGTGSALYPPDLAASGVDTEALVVVNVSDEYPVDSSGVSKLSTNCPQPASSRMMTIPMSPPRPRKRRESACSRLRAADLLLRSGGFGFIVVDMSTNTRGPAPPVSTTPGGTTPPPFVRPTDGQLGRLLGLAQKHQAAIVFLTDATPDGSSLGSLVSLRIVVTRASAGSQAARFTVVAETTKDKRHAPGRRFEERLRAPDGVT